VTLDWDGSIVRLCRAGADENYDFADHTENGRIRLCIEAGSRQTAAWDTNGSRAAVPKKSRRVV